jgi:hypothetical protein
VRRFRPLTFTKGTGAFKWCLQIICLKKWWQVLFTRCKDSRRKIKGTKSKMHMVISSTFRPNQMPKWCLTSSRVSMRKQVVLKMFCPIQNWDLNMGLGWWTNQKRAWVQEKDLQVLKVQWTFMITQTCKVWTTQTWVSSQIRVGWWTRAVHRS